ncbi:hypothetical protein [Paracoccus haematequi]|uniref:hypothetical protein n=1 Tax=Paracoccus haematequi TaxID=2491866 RepID=UPI000F7EEAAE|nr:hypothetical protein [Paracoccus haematequi]
MDIAARSNRYQHVVNNALAASSDPVERSRHLTGVLLSLEGDELLAFAYVLLREVSLTPPR